MNQPIWHKIFAFVGVWQGVILPSIPELTEWLRFTSAGLGVFIGIVTILQNFKERKKQRNERPGKNI